MEKRAQNPVAPGSQTCRETGVLVERIAYHGWPECYLLANGSAEAVIVPAIGRILQFRLAGETTGAFWENRALDGLLHPANLHPDPSGEWINFGGDKCWPAPQSEWPRQQGRDWPPPAAFDAAPVTAVAGARGVLLTSPVDPAFGIQVTRLVELDAGRPILRIKTAFHKLLGDPLRVSVWTITQMEDPERVRVLLNEKSSFEKGYLSLLKGEPQNLKIEDRVLSLARHPRDYVKIGADAASLEWVGRTCKVRIDAETGPGEYPDGGCVTQVYTNPDPLKYVELETLGPLTTISAGDRIERTTVYTITPL
jgi:hypothetical protein